MPIHTWRSYATKVRKKSKSDFREYTHRSPLWKAAEASNSNSDEQSGQVAQEEEKVMCSDVSLLVPDERPSVEENSEDVNMKLRPPIETYEKLDDFVEEEMKKFTQGFAYKPPGSPEKKPRKKRESKPTQKSSLHNPQESE